MDHPHAYCTDVVLIAGAQMLAAAQYLARGSE
jgi:hypothetical protein